MDKRCKDCIYKGYQENDPQEVWPFCMCKDEDLRKKTAEYWNHIHKYSIRYGVEHKIKEFPKENVPSCQMVQAAYSELYGTTCPNYKGVANVQEKE
jgi:hypothetical protein